MEIRHIATHEIKNVHVTRLKMYHGDRAAGYETALRDADQYVVIEILAWRGTVTERSCMWFKVHYADGDILWQEWSRDLDNSAAYSNFIHREKPLYLLRFKAHIADRERVALNKRHITEVEPGDSVYVDLRAWNPIWYDQLELPNAYEILHVVLCQYTEWRGREKLKIILPCELFNENILYEHYDVYCFETIKFFYPDSMLLLDKTFALSFSHILPEDKRERLLQQF